MRKLLLFFLVLLVLSVSACGQQVTPTPAKDVLSPARVQELEAQVQDLDSRIQKRLADLKALEATIPREEMKIGAYWGAFIVDENGTPVGDMPGTPSPRYREYARLQDETFALIEEERSLSELLPPTPVRPTPDIQPRLSKEQVVQIVQKYLRSLTQEQANDLDVGQEWDLLQDEWPVRWKTHFYPAGQQWEIECFEANIYVDDASGKVAGIVPGSWRGNDFAHEVEP